MQSSYDVVVVGAGPAGLSVGIACKKQGLKCLIIDRGSIVNTIRRYPTYAVFFSTSELLELGGIPFPAINKQPTRQEALKYYLKLTEYFGLEFELYTEVLGIEKQEGLFSIHTSKGNVQAKKVVVSIGYYDQSNRLKVPGEDLPHVSHFYTEPFEFAGRKVLVVGGSNSAGESALDLYRNGVEVTLVHRGSELYHKMKYWVRPDLENRIKQGSIKAHFNTTVKEIRDGEVELQTGSETHTVAVDHVLALIGYHPEVSFLEKIGVAFDAETYVPVFDENTLESNIGGLYLAGTVLTGKNTSKIFIENSRHHGGVIVDDILKQSQSSN